jgi:UDP-glucuronate 4-epimerase
MTPEVHPARALVTGCAGFIGSHLAEALVDAGTEVVGIDCLTPYYDPALKLDNLTRLRESGRFTHHRLDLATDELDEVLEGVDAVFHLAAQPGVRSSFRGFDAYVRNNVLATQRLLEASAGSDGLNAFVYASSSSVYGDSERFPTGEDAPLRPLSPYGMTKVSTEELARFYHRTAGLKTVGLRYFTAFGPRQRPDMAFARFIAQALDGEPLPVNGDGLQIRDFTYVSDVVDGTIAGVRGCGGTAYNIGGGVPVTLLEVIATLETILETKLELETRPSARGDARRTGADGSRAQVDLGFAPKVSLEAGLAAQVEHFRASARRALAV